MADEVTLDTVGLATELTIAWLGNQNTRVSADDVPAFLQRMHQSLSELADAGETAPPVPEEAREYPPAVSVRKSLASPDHLVSLIDGRAYKTLRRHLGSHNLTPDQYRARYKLKADYPMVAPAYSEARRATAKRLGLGRKPKSETPPAPAEPATAPAKVKRAPRKKADATA